MSGFDSLLGLTDGFLVDASKARELHDELLAAKPEGARHDADICSFCVENASQNPPVPSGPEAGTASEDTEGGTTTAMSENEQKTMTVETHEALLEKALREATSATEKALADKIEENTKLTSEVASLKETNEKLEADNARLNGELDKAQLDLKAATDEVAALKDEKAQIEEAAAKADVASKRAEQVRNLGLFEETFITERASRWADLDQAAWDERVEEWTARKAEATPPGDQASAMSGTSGDLTKVTDEASNNSDEPKPRRAVLGL